jgi:hypothetical protein
MMKIELCECCGDAIEIDTADEWDGNCHECNPFDEDLIGLYETEDEK